MFCVVIQQSDFDIAQLQQSLRTEDAAEGAIATFTGYVRVDKDDTEFEYLELEHYPQMTEKSIETILLKAAERWPLISGSVVHRVGRLYPGEQIVWVGIASAHRAAAFSACEYVMDYLKAEAPLWKKEHGGKGSEWVEVKGSDVGRAGRWSEG